jgi:hypothetical protein
MDPLTPLVILLALLPSIPIAILTYHLGKKAEQNLKDATDALNEALRKLDQKK